LNIKIKRKKKKEKEKEKRKKEEEQLCSFLIVTLNLYHGEKYSSYSNNVLLCYIPCYLVAI
jgi:hypothetical protein